MISAVATHMTDITTGTDAINGLYKITRCQYCHQYSISLSQAICPHCGQPLTGPSAAINLYDHDLLYCDDGFFDKKPEYLEKASPITAYNIIDQRILDLLRNNRNWFGGICGDTGTGKSYTALRVGELTDRTFDADKVAFNVLELLLLIDSVSSKELIVFDEAEAWNARRAMKAENVALGEIMSMLRYTQKNVACTMPDLEMIDINARRLMQDYLRTMYIRRNKAPAWQRDKSAVDWYVIKKLKIPQNDKSSLYFARPIVEYPDYENGIMRKEKCGTVYLNAPDPTLLEEYEKRKDKKFKIKLQDVLKTFNKIKKDHPDMPTVSLDANLDAKVAAARQAATANQKRPSSMTLLDAIRELADEEQ
jgi:hypothetical protein